MKAHDIAQSMAVRQTEVLQEVAAKKAHGIGPRYQAGYSRGHDDGVALAVERIMVHREVQLQIAKHSTDRDIRERAKYAAAILEIVGADLSVK